MQALTQDLALAFRLLRRQRGFTLAAALTLAVGIGANASIITLLDATFLRPLAVPDAERLVHVYQRRDTSGPYPIALADYFYYREHATTFEVLAAHYPTSPLHVIIGGEPLSTIGAVATASYFDALGIEPLLGRWFSEDEDRVPDRDAVAVISEALWQQRFAADPAILGRSLTVNGRQLTVIGVAPRGFKGVLGRGVQTELWIPSAMFKVGYRFCDAFARGCNIVQMLGRLRPGTSSVSAQRELDVLSAQLEAAYPTTNKSRGVTIVDARGLGRGTQPEEITQMRLFSVVAGAVLLIACANIAGLLLARATGRRREIALRLALGASRWRIVRQLLTESLVLSAIGGGSGLLLAVWGNRGLELLYARNNSGLPVDVTLELRPLVIVIVLVLIAGAAILSGLIPALHASRVGIGATLKDEGASGGAERARLRQILVAAQVALSVMLLVAAGLVLRSLVNVMAGPGFDPEPIVMLRLRPSLIDYSTERSQGYQREVVRRVEALPGVVSASPAEFLSLVGAGRSAEVSAADRSDVRDLLEASAGHIGPRYFATLGVPLVEGREMAETDDAQAPRVAVINDVLARRLWPGDGANGRTVVISGRSHTVIGVVRDAQYYAAGENRRPQVFLSYWQSDAADAFGKDSRMHVRVAGAARGMLPTIRRAVAAVDPNVPISEDYSLSDRVSFIYQPLRMARALLVSLGVVALFLSAMGLYSVLAFIIGQRTREIGIRVALGAQQRTVRRMVLRQGLGVTVIGVAIGLLCAWLSSRLVAGLLYGVNPHDPVTFAAAAMILLGVAGAASYLPARRAALISPVEALRE
ncbi:MAG: ABC transporter permease [Vicinamibacterales bacterium]